MALSNKTEPTWSKEPHLGNPFLSLIELFRMTLLTPLLLNLIPLSSTVALLVTTPKRNLGYRTLGIKIG